MSRIGKQPIAVPDGVQVQLADNTIQVKGPKGELAFTHVSGLKVRHDADSKKIQVERPNDDRKFRALHGLTRSLIANMVKGVTEGFTKKLEIVGVGYQAQKKGDALVLQVGFANALSVTPPPGVTVTVTDPTHVTIQGPDKQKVGQFAAVVRKLRPPEPYKGKGIRYEGEVVRRKAGKAFGGSS